MSSPRARSYTLDEKRHAIARALVLGPSQASKELKISAGTLSCWLFKARKGHPGYPLPEPEPQGSQQEVAAEVESTDKALQNCAQEADNTPVQTASKVAEAPPVQTASELAEAPALPSESSPPSSASVNRVARIYTPSERDRALQLAAEVGVTQASRRLGISRFSIYEWRRRVKLAAAGQGEDPTSGSSQADLVQQRDREILDVWKTHPGLGPSQIRNQLRRKGVKASVTTVRRVMEANGYRPPKVKRHPHTRRYEATRPNHLWHLDFVHRYINRARTFTLILLDDRSRFVVGHGVDDAERADLVLQTFEEAVARYGRPERVMHDKGSAFWSWKGISRFTALLTELGIDQVVAEHKEWNGKVEAFNATLAKELFNVHKCADVAEMKRRLAAHLHFYNHSRTHLALKGGTLVPADVYYGRIEEILARLQTGNWADAHEDVGLRDRPIDVLRVVTRNGTPEVWVLGQRVGSLGAPQ